jgi:hypothetical protein
MSEEQNKSSKLDDLIFEKMDELIEARRDIWEWVVTEHSIKDTETRLSQFSTLSKEISNIARKLVEHKKAASRDERKEREKKRRCTIDGRLHYSIPVFDHFLLLQIAITI